MTDTVCPCGAVFTRDRDTAWCHQCRTPETRKVSGRDKSRSNRQRGYSTEWINLSRRARRLQNFCTDCGRTDTLTLDHSPEAWRRHWAGLPIRLQDTAVRCGPCNRAKGDARTVAAADPTPDRTIR